METFNAGDIVFDEDNKKAIIESVINCGIGTGRLYTILKENGTIKVVSAEHISKEDRNILKKKEEVEEEISRIIDELELTESDDTIVQIQNCCRLQEYFVKNLLPIKEPIKEKEKVSLKDLQLAEIYNALVLKRGVCTSNSIAFKEILSRLGIEVKTVGLISKGNGKPSFSNLVLLGDSYYFFDSILEQKVYNSQESSDKTDLYCAGLGKNTYEKFYEIKYELESPTEPPAPVPLNISLEDISKELINNPDCNQKCL